MHDRAPLPQEKSQRLSRRNILRAGAGLGAAALTVAGGRAAYDPAMQIVKDRLNIGDDYSNYPFLEAVGARYINQDRLNELLANSTDKALAAERASQRSQTNPKNLAEFTFMSEEPGPVYVTFDGLRGDTVSLAIFKVSVDDGEEFYLPVVKGPNQETPAEIQLGTHKDGEHRFDVSVAYSSSVVTPEEVIPHFTSGQTGSFRDFIDRSQPDIYLQDYSNIANNAPLKSAAFVYETDRHLALVYWTECLGEDPEYWFFGTSVKELLATKNRPTDWDWVLEALIRKSDGSIELASIAEPFHTRTALTLDSSHVINPPLRIASANNNVRSVRRDSTLALPRIRPRPTLHTHDDRKTILYRTGQDTATLSLLEHSKKGNVDLEDADIIGRLGTLGVDVTHLSD